jgi:exosortase/archaeosortase family protein
MSSTRIAANLPAAAIATSARDGVPLAAGSAVNRPLRVLIASTAALAAVPVVWAALFSTSTDLAVITALVFGGAAWHLWRQVPARPSAATGTVAAWLGLAAMTSQLSWTGIEGIWFWRGALIAWAVACTTLWGGARRGWRVIMAFAITATWLGGTHPAIAASIGSWSARRTAIGAGWLLWQAGCDVTVRGASIQTPTALVEVGEPCTGLPLACLLLGLLAVAALLLRLRWTALLRLVPIVIVSAFMIGVVRVALLTLVASDKARFNYWHGPHGGSWFSAAAILLLAWQLSREVHRHPGPHRPAGRTTTDIPVGWRHAAWPIAAGLGCSAILALTIRSTPAASNPTAPALPHLTLTSDRVTPHDVAATETDRATTVEHAVYGASTADASIEVTLARVPVLFTGDPRILAANEDPAAVFGPWTLHREETGREVWVSHRGRQTAWLAVITPDGDTIARHEDWVRHCRAAFRQPSSWIAWLAHRRPLPDKSAAWLLVCGEVPSAADATRVENNVALVFEAWRRHAFAVAGNTRPTP